MAAVALFTLALWIRQMRLELRKDRPDEPHRGKPEPPPMTSPFEPAIIAARRNDHELELKARQTDIEPSHGGHA